MLQIVKGWEDANGEVHEKVYNVALSDGRALSGNPEPVGNTVDLKNATYSNSIGDAELSTLWTDPDFDASQDSFYYVRVLEIPTPRWTVYDAKFFGTELNERWIPNCNSGKSPIHLQFGIRLNKNDKNEIYI